MKNDWNTIFREAQIAAESLRIVRQAWVNAPSLSNDESLLERVCNYLSDRFDIEIEFCSICQ